MAWRKRIIASNLSVQSLKKGNDAMQKMPKKCPYVLERWSSVWLQSWSRGRRNFESIRIVHGPQKNTPRLPLFTDKNIFSSRNFCSRALQEMPLRSSCQSVKYRAASIMAGKKQKYEYFALGVTQKKRDALYKKFSSRWSNFLLTHPQATKLDGCLDFAQHLLKSQLLALENAVPAYLLSILNIFTQIACEIVYSKNSVRCRLPKGGC